MTKNEQKSGLTIERLREVLRYDPDTGEFFWVIDMKWRRPAGSLAGRVHGPKKPYGLRRQHTRTVSFDSVSFFDYRLAWFFMTGRWPEHQLDHKNGDRLDCRWSNLREATPSQNQMNRRRYRSNTVGVKGVSEARKGKFRARIQFGKKRVCLGYFDTPSAALAARVSRLGELHGEFARAA